MSSRSRIDFISKKGEEIRIESEKPSTMVYISKCEGCTFLITKSVGKVYVESSSGCKLELREKIMSSLCEVYKCTELTLVPDSIHALHTLTIESCKGVTLLARTPTQLQNIVINSCSEFKYCLVHPYPLESIPDLSRCEAGAQYLIVWEGGCQGGLAVKALTRRGGYITTVEQAEIADKKEEELMNKMIEIAIGKVLPSKGGQSPKGDKIPANTGASDGKVPVNTGAADGKVPVNTGAADGKVPVNTGAADGKVGKVPANTGESGDTHKSRPLVEGTAEFQQKLGEVRGKLKPTETIVREGPVIPGAKPHPRGAGQQYNIEDEEQKKEFVDSAEELERKVGEVGKWIREGKHVIFFTGAGISTSAGIPDFRSGLDTMLDTGPGMWELRAHGQTRRPGKAVKLISALPTATHMSLVSLHEAGLVKFTVSQNVDGLHRRSGMNPNQLAELHGNTNLESCSVCGTQYLRDFETREAFGVFNHETTRRCDDPACRNVLLDSIINFGEQLPVREIREAFDHAGRADVCIVLGSSLTVQPAANVPATVGSRNGKLAICNLQKTPLYKLATVNVHSMCDVFMKKLVEDELKISIPPFKLKRRAKFSMLQTSMLGDWEFSIEGLDVFQDTPYSFIQALYTKLSKQENEIRIDKEPFCYKFKAELGYVLKIILVFQGHYNEPDFELDLGVNAGAKQLNLEYEVGKGTWTHTLSDMSA